MRKSSSVRLGNKRSGSPAKPHSTSTAATRCLAIRSCFTIIAIRRRERRSLSAIAQSMRPICEMTARWRRRPRRWRIASEMANVWC